MSRYPFSIQRTPSLSNNNSQFLNSKRSNDNLGTHNPYTQFHEGHAPVYGDDADWHQSRNSTKQSTGSLSSFQSWTSEDPAFSSHTSSFSQYTPPSSQQIAPFPLGKAQQQQQQHRPYQPRGESLMSTTSSAAGGRHRSNSNNSNISNNHAMQYQQQQQQQQQHQQQNYNQHGAQQQYDHNNYNGHNNNQFNDNSHHNNSHLSYSSQASGHSQSFGNLYHQQQQQQQPYDHQLHEQNRGSEQYSAERSAAHKQSRTSPGSDISQNQHQHQESPRTSQRAQRRREPAVSEETKMRSLDDYEAMLQEMTSPTLGPKGGSSSRSATAAAAAMAAHTLDDYEAMLQEMTSPTLGPREGRGAREARSAARRHEREAREVRSAKQPQRQQQRQQEQQRPQRQHEQKGSSQNMNTQQTLSDQSTDQASFEERRLRRRSSLPSKLKSAPNMFANLQRRNSGSGQLAVAPESSISGSAPSSQTHDHIPPPQPKRFSWENESIAPRADLLQSNNNAGRPGSLQRKGSWQDLNVPDEISAEQEQRHLLSQHDANAPPLTTKSHMRLGNSPTDDEGPVSFLSVENEPFPRARSSQPEATALSVSSRDHGAERGAATPPPLAPRPPMNSRSRPSTPVGGIRPPPGPAPAQGGLSRKVSPRSGKQVSRPRAGSAASVNSMNGFTIERVLTPPPPSAPLPSLPQTPPMQASTLLATNDGVVGLGVGQPQAASRKISGGKDLVLPASQLVYQGDSAVLASSLPVSSDMSDAATAAATAANQAAHMARLKKRVSILEKELANTEMELSTRIRDGSELQFKVEQLTVERDALEKKLAEMASASLTRGDIVSNEHSSSRSNNNSTRSPDLDRASLQFLHDQELTQAVKQVQEEKEVLLEAMMERQDRSRSEMAAQMEEIRAQLVQKDEEIFHLQGELQSSHQHATVAAATAATSAVAAHESQTQRLNREIENLVARQSSLEQELVEARGEIQHLQAMIEQKEQRELKETQDKHELESKLAALMLTTQEHEQHTQEHQRIRGELEGELEQLRSVTREHGQYSQDHERVRGELEAELEQLKLAMQEHEQHRQEHERVRGELEGELEQLKLMTQEHEQHRQEHERVRGELEQEIHGLRSENSRHEESIVNAERELEASFARSQQEAMQYKSLQDSVQRLSSKMTRLESQHEDDLQQIHIDHENAMADLEGRHKIESEALVDRTRREVNDSFYEERGELDARERVLRDRIFEQSSRNDQLEEEIFSLQKALEASNKERDVQARTNRSLERHLSMQHIQEQETMYKFEELESENARLRGLLSELDVVAAKKETPENEGDEEENKEETSVEMKFEQQHRRWIEQAELMERRLARAEEEARRAMDQNEELRVALELAQTAKHQHQRFSLASPSPSLSSRVLSPPLSAGVP